jgi:hypothetical protein
MCPALLAGVEDFLWHTTFAIGISGIQFHFQFMQLLFRNKIVDNIKFLTSVNSVDLPFNKIAVPARTFFLSYHVRTLYSKTILDQGIVGSQLFQPVLGKVVNHLKHLQTVLIIKSNGNYNFYNF